MKKNYWIFSNMPEGKYGESDWDMKSILERKSYYFRKKERNLASVKTDDFVIMRIFGQSYMGTFEVAGDTIEDKEGVDKHNMETVWLPMKKIEIWPRALPQSIIIRELSNQDARSRIIRITNEDVIRIRTASIIHDKLGYGPADGEVLLLEKGIEEAIKPNLNGLGLKLATKRIQQQFSMGPGVGRSDLICEDQSGNLVVMELKRGMASDDAVGQVLRYVGFVKESVANNGQQVHGWIITPEYDEHLRLAASAAGVRVIRVRLA